MKELNFTMQEIKKLTTLQVNMYVQRHNEPYWKQEIDNYVNKSKGKHGRR